MKKTISLMLILILSGCGQKANTVEECITKIRKIDIPDKCLQSETGYECEERLMKYCGEEFLIDLSKEQLNKIVILNGELNNTNRYVTLEIINKNDDVDIQQFDFEIIIDKDKVGTGNYYNYQGEPLRRLKKDESRKTKINIYNYKQKTNGKGFEINIINGKGFTSK